MLMNDPIISIGEELDPKISMFRKGYWYMQSEAKLNNSKDITIMGRGPISEGGKTHHTRCRLEFLVGFAQDQLLAADEYDSEGSGTYITDDVTMANYYTFDEACKVIRYRYRTFDEKMNMYLYEKYKKHGKDHTVQISVMRDFEDLMNGEFQQKNYEVGETKPHVHRPEITSNITIISEIANGHYAIKINKFDLTEYPTELYGELDILDNSIRIKK